MSSPPEAEFGHAFPSIRKMLSVVMAQQGSGLLGPDRHPKTLNIHVRNDQGKLLAPTGRLQYRTEPDSMQGADTSRRAVRAAPPRASPPHMLVRLEPVGATPPVAVDACARKLEMRPATNRARESRGPV